MQGLKALKAHPQSANLVQSYERIANGVAGAAQTIDLQGLELTADLLKMAYECYCNDYPQHFWLASTYTYTTQNDIVCTVSPQYHMTGSELTAAKIRFDQAVNSILGKLSGSMSAYEKELAIHDALLNQCQYKEGNYPYSAYGALVEGMAVCEGYARAFQYLMHQTGISCMVVSGFGNGEAHAWNAVQIGSSWYYTDVTWDDPLDGDGTLHYAYFNLTREAMDLDHTADMEFIPLPNATATTYNYFVRNGTYLQQYDQSQLAQILRRDHSARLYVAGDVDGFIQSFKSNISGILADAGIQDCTGYSYTVCGKELIITLQRGT